MSHVRAICAANAALALPALRELPPQSHALADGASFAAHLAATHAEGYRLAGTFEDGRTKAAAATEYRVMDMLAYGPVLYLDDLSTLPDAWGRGHARALLEWLDTEALHLDSGVGAARFTAHRQDLRHGMNITAHHFAKELGTGELT
ncbi:GNAT family N-acetyltransferase [Deinococcus arenicola]|uniref:GNAT family N-acetyltransferase n=1 Tax=Deinococcus arenicola TaxID=2994950 RepID=A0ABU4DTP7_9DEIO|nr:GNAT family N-acetyltransferase [Deinococcus sp. ZS9-10]MDV6375798.1 GNAT family N-acetyltransferase [Deinococcus sp. ZS9-10]